jgi:hypothetical protein
LGSGKIGRKGRKGRIGRIGRKGRIGRIGRVGRRKKNPYHGTVIGDVLNYATAISEPQGQVGQPLSIHV